MTVKTLQGRRRVALLAVGVMAATGVALAPGYAAAGPVTIDRTSSTDWGWDPQGCSSAAPSQDVPVPVDGPVGVPHGAGSLKVPVSDDVYGEYGVPSVRSAADLTSYSLTMMSPTGELALVAGIQPSGQASRFLTTTLSVPANTWQVVDLTTVSWNHYPSNQARYWGPETPDDTGPLSHFVGSTSNVAFRPAVAVLGCDSNGGVGPRQTYLDQSTIQSYDASEPHVGTIDHEPATAPTPVLSTSPDVTITYDQRPTLSTAMLYGASIPAAGRFIRLERAAPGTENWASSGGAITASDGRASSTFLLDRNTSFRWVFLPDALGYFEGATSGRTEVVIRTKVFPWLIERTVRRGDTVRVKCALHPIPPEGTKVTLWRWGTRHVRLDRATTDRRGVAKLFTPATRAGTLPLRVMSAATARNAAGLSRLMKAHVTR